MRIKIEFATNVLTKRSNYLFNLTTTVLFPNTKTNFPYHHNLININKKKKKEV